MVEGLDGKSCPAIRNSFYKLKPWAREAQLGGDRLAGVERP